MIHPLKTTLIIPDHLMRELRERAARKGETLSATVAETIRRGLEAHDTSAPTTPLPTHRMGRPKVDVSDRDALYRAMEGQ